MDTDPASLAREALFTARISRAIRDVSHEVEVVRASLKEAKMTPDEIGSSEMELATLLKDGLISEARTLFDLASDGAGGTEREIYFRHIVELVSRSATVPLPKSDLEVVEDLRRSNPVLDGFAQANQTANRAVTATVFGDLDVDNLDFNFEEAAPVPDAPAAAESAVRMASDYPEITIVRESEAPEDLEGSSDGDDATDDEEDEDDDSIEVQDEWILGETPNPDTAPRRAAPPPLPPRSDMQVSVALCTSDLFMPGESPDGPPNFTSDEEAWFAKCR